MNFFYLLFNNISSVGIEWYEMEFFLKDSGLFTSVMIVINHPSNQSGFKSILSGQHTVSW